MTRHLDQNDQSLNLSVTLKTLLGTSEATLISFLPSEVVVRTETMVDDGAPVEIEVKSVLLHGRILYSVPAGSGFEAHIHLAANEEEGLRKAPRFNVEIPAVVWSGNSEEPLDVTILDISCDGLGLKLAGELCAGESVAIDWESNMGFGLVRYCTPGEEGVFRAGVEMCHVVSRRPEHASPKHSPVVTLLRNTLASLIVGDAD